MTTGVDAATVGQRIERGRKRLGKSQRGFGELVGVSQAMVSKWESGQSIPNLSHAQRLAAVCHRNVRFFLVTAVLSLITLCLISDQLSDAVGGVLS